MTTDTMAMIDLFVAMNEMTGRKAAVVPEPEFTRFKLAERKAAAAVRAGELTPANDPAANERAA